MEFGTIYLICAVAGGTILVLRLIMMLFGMDDGDAPDVDAHIDLDHDGVLDAGDAHGGFFNFLSIQSVAGFFTMFGIVGLGLLQINASDIWSLVGALAAGVFTAWCTGLIFMAMRRLQSDGTLKVQNAIGQQGTVYLTIPRKGTGSISITIQGALRTMDAISQNGQKIPTGSIVKVVDIAAGDILVVSEQPLESRALSEN